MLRRSPERTQRASDASSSPQPARPFPFACAQGDMSIAGGDAQPLLWNTSFGPAQKIFTTISSLGPEPRPMPQTRCWMLSVETTGTCHETRDMRGQI